MFLNANEILYERQLGFTQLMLFQQLLKQANDKLKTQTSLKILIVGYSLICRVLLILESQYTS